MAKGITRWIRAVFDRDAAKKVEDQLVDSLTSAGKKGGEGFLKALRSEFDKRIAELRVALAKGVIDPAQFKKMSAEAAKQFNAGIVQGMDAARKAGTLTDREFQKLSKTLKKVGDDGKASGGILQSSFAKIGAFVAASFGAKQVIDFFRESIQAGIAAEESIERFSLSLEKLGISYAQVAPEAEAYFAQLQLTTKFTDEDARDALTNLITITGSYDKSLKLLGLTADVAAKRHVTMAEAAETVGKASLGLSKGMQDLGIKAGETGDIVGKLRINVGGFAEGEGKTFGGRVAILNNLWGEFKEKLGAAVIGSNNLGGAIGRMQAAIVAMTEWVDKNGKSLGAFLDRLVLAGEALVKLSGFILTHTPNLYTLSKGYDWLREKIVGVGEATVATTKAIVVGAGQRRDATAEEQAVLAKLLEDGGDAREKLTAHEVQVLGKIRKDAAAGHLTLAKAQDDALGDFFKSRQEAANKAAEAEAKAFRERKAEIEQEIADLKRLRAAQGTGNATDKDSTTQALKDEADQRKAVTGVSKEQGKALLDLLIIRNRERNAIKASNDAEQERIDLARTYDGLQRDDRAEADRRKGVLTGIREETQFERDRAEARKKGTRALLEFDQQAARSRAQAEAGPGFSDRELQEIGDFAAAHVEKAEVVKTVWTQAFDAVGEAAVGAFAALGDGGIKGLAVYAKAQAKLMLAEAIGQLARAAAAFAFGPIGAVSAADHLKSAAAFGSAAVAFGGVATFGGGGGSGGSGGGVPSSGGSVAPPGTSAQPPGPDITIVLDGPGFDAMNPRVQEVVFGAQQQARERWGDNANVRVVRRGS